MAEPTEADLDALLRLAARRAVDDAAPQVDVDADLAHVRHRLGTPAPVRRPWAGRGSRRWLAAAAAVALLAGGLLVAITSRDDDQIQVAGASTTAATAPITTDAASTTTPDTPASTTAATIAVSTTTSTTVPAPAAAVAVPGLAAPLQLVTITPSEPVAYCFVSQVTVATAGDRQLRQVGLIDPDGSYAETQTPAIACDGGPAVDSPISLRVPLELGADDYVVCLAGLENPAGCAPVSVRKWPDSCFETRTAPIAPPGLIDGSDPGEPAMSPDGTTATWGAGRLAISQPVGERPDETWVSPHQLAQSDTYEVLQTFEPDARVLTIIGGPDFCPRRYRISAGLDDTHLRALVRGWLAFFADGTPVPTDGHDELSAPSEYFGVRYYTVGDESVTAVHRFAPDGRDLGEVDEGELVPDPSGVQLDDGRRIRFDPSSEPGDRCQNRPLILSDGSGERALHPDLTDAYSFVSTPNGFVVATRVVCPSGGWDPADSLTQILALDLAQPEAGARVLLEVAAGPGDFAGRSVTWISPDGRLIALSQPVSGEAADQTIVATDDATVPIQLPSGCAGATGVVSRPQVVADTVFVARACPSGDGRFVTIDQLALADLSLVWSATVEREMLAYCNCAGVSVGGGAVPSVIVTGSASIEEPNTSILIVGDQQTDITHLGFATLAFTVAELLPPAS